MSADGALPAAALDAAELTDAEWRAVPGYRCSVTRCGRVRGPAGAELGGWLDRYGYRRVNVRNLAVGLFRQTPVHRLVALAFLGPAPSPKHQVAHGDGVRTHNHVDNLRWATGTENQHDRVAHGTLAVGEDVHCAKLTAEQVRYIRARCKPGARKGPSVAALARRFGVSRIAIESARVGKTWRHV